MQLHQAGDIEAATTLYAGILEAHPHHASALHFLGVAAAQKGNRDEALVYLQRSIEAEPTSVQFLNNYGMVLKDCGRLDEAAEHFARVLALDPALPEAHNNLGTVLRRQENFDAAATSFRTAIELRPGYVEAHINLGNTLADLGRHNDAITAHRRAAALNPRSAEVQNNLGNALKDSGALVEAVTALTAAVELDPAFAEAHNNLGVAFYEQGRHADAAGACRTALALNPGFADAHVNLGNALNDQGWFGDAILCHDKALSLCSDFVDAHVNRAFSLLALGRIKEGWREYEHRLRKREALRMPVAAPAWDGSTLGGTTILVRAEQGIGDEILFASCFPDLMARAGHCVIECEPRLGSLFARSFPTATVRGSARDDRTWLADAPAIDTHVMLASLMHHLRPDIASFPAHDGYLVADPAARARFADRLAALGPGPKVGISWRSMRGSRFHASYTALDEWRDILRLPGLQFVNLQYDGSGPEVTEVNDRFGVRVHDFADLDLLNDFEGLAALIATLDLVIAPGNTVNALGGALGAPVWLLDLASNWGSFGTDRYPWFPSVTVYRRECGMADWTPVLERVAMDLATLAESGAG